MNVKIGYILFLLMIVPFIIYRIYALPTIKYDDDLDYTKRGLVTIEKIDINSTIVPIDNNKAIYFENFKLNDKGHILLKNKTGSIILWLDNPNKSDIEIVLNIDIHSKFEDIDVTINGNNFYSIKNQSMVQHNIIIPNSFISDNVLDIKFIKTHSNDILHLTAIGIIGRK